MGTICLVTKAVARKIEYCRTSKQQGSSNERLTWHLLPRRASSKSSALMLSEAYALALLRRLSFCWSLTPDGPRHYYGKQMLELDTLQLSDC